MCIRWFFNIDFLTFVIQLGSTFIIILNDVKFTEELCFILTLCSNTSTYFVPVFFGVCSIVMINVGSFALMRWFSLLLDRP
jgi:hypothetical protein